MGNADQEPGGTPSVPPTILLPLAPVLMMSFWMLLGGAAGIKLSQSLWQLFGWGGEVAVAIPVGGMVGVVIGAALGRIRNPRRLVLLMAVFAGSAAGGVAGKVGWDEVGEIGGQLVGGFIGGLAWATWLLVGRSHSPEPHAPCEKPPS